VTGIGRFRIDSDPENLNRIQRAGLLKGLRSLGGRIGVGKRGEQVNKERGENE